MLCLVAVYAANVSRAAERYVFDVFDRERGLGNSTVTRLASDHEGALWVGTGNGLYRYDGHRFLAFTTSEGLPGNKITAIHESPDGILWVGTLEGLAWREGARFRKSTNEALKGYINIQGIASDRTGRVFIATRKGIVVASPPAPGEDVKVTFLSWPAVVPQRRSSNVYVVSPDEVWFDCGVAICRWNGKEVRVWDSNAGVPPQRWDLFLKDRAGNLWARNRESFIRLSPGADRFQTIDPELFSPISVPPELAMDSKGRILATTNHGLMIGGPGGWRSVTEKQGLPANFVTAVLQDGEGSMWLGTYGGGLARWAGYDACRSFTEIEGLASSSITSLLEDPASGMWAGTAAGLSHGVFSKGTWNWSEISIPGAGLVSSLVRTNDGSLWMATGGHYVIRYDPATGAARRLGPFVDGPFHLRLDSAGRLWIAEAGSIAVAGTQSRLENFERIRPPGTNPATLFTATLEDTRGNLWIGSMSGLFRRAQGKWFRYDASSGLRANRIIDLALSPEDDLWVSYSEPKGADRIRVTGDTIQVENFDGSKGLTSNRVNSIGFDRQGQLWILNDHGAQVRRRDTWVQFSRADGLINSGSTGRAFWAGADGSIWIGGDRGLSRYQPGETIRQPNEPLRVRFSEVRVGNKSFDWESTSFVETNPLTFEAKFSALLLAHGRDVQYRYRFAGIDDRWRETAVPEARLDYPPPGRYRLEVQARTNGQSWSGPPVALALEVRPRWHQTTLFRGILLALACAAIWLIGKLRQRKALTARLTLERKVEQRTAELRESEERFRNMADTAPVMIWVSSPDQRCTFVNKGWLDFTGRTMEQELETGWASGVHPDDLDRCLAMYSSSFDARQDFRIEYRLRRADGSYRWVLDHGIPLLGPGGVFQGFIGSCLDITDLKLAQEASLSRQKLESIGMLAAGIAHDFNNLLCSIVADTDIALLEMAAGPAPVEEIERIKTVAFRASEIVRELMVYSGQDMAEVEPVQISLLVEDMVELLKISLSKRATLKIDLKKDLPTIRGHAPQIRQVLMNLIINASEAIGENEGMIKVSASRATGGKNLAPGSATELAQGDYVRLEVSDTGCGMTAEQKTRIFDPFFTTKFAGRGLGLAVVQGSVHAHNGAINVVSAPGQGTMIEVFFPCWGQPAKSEDGSNASGSVQDITQTTGTVLLVEDEHLLRLSIAKVLRREHFSVIEVGDGSAALDLLRDNLHDIDLILLDLTIPGATSREVLEEAQRIQHGMKVVVTSAYSKDVAEHSINMAQVAGFIRKPFQLADLVQLIRETLGPGGLP